MNSAFYFSQLQQFLDYYLKPLRSSALVASTGESLSVCYDNLSDLGTLSSAAQTSHSYLKLKDGDIVITNDPYSGGSVLSSFTLIMGISSQATRKTKNQAQADLLLSFRISLKPKVSNATKIEEEGLRLPPSPLYMPLMEKPINSDLIEAIKQHPLCPLDFENEVNQAIEVLLDRHKKFKVYTKHLGLDWSKSLIKKYLKKTEEKTQKLIGQLHLGESRAEHVLEDGTRIKLNVTVSEKSVLFDFTGTDQSSLLNLTDSATYGACIGAMLAIFSENIPVNLGFYNSFEIIAPSGSIVNAVYPQPIYQGMVDGTQLIANLVLKAVGNLDKNRLVADSNPTLCAFELEFEGGKRFFETLYPGVPASGVKKGEDGVSVWTKSHLNPRLELIEKLFPLHLKTYAFRTNSGGTGLYPGGNGITKAVTLKAPAQFRWTLTAPKHNPLGVEGGKSASGAEIYITKKGDEKERLPSRGETQLQAGDTVIVHSAGGGGFGEEDKGA